MDDTREHGDGVDTSAATGAAVEVGGGHVSHTQAHAHHAPRTTYQNSYARGHTHTRAQHAQAHAQAHTRAHTHASYTRARAYTHIAHARTPTHPSIRPHTQVGGDELQDV